MVFGSGVIYLLCYGENSAYTPADALGINRLVEQPS